MPEPSIAIGATDVGPVDVEHVGLGPVRLGAMLFTLVDPHRGHEVAYNRWYERDHLMAGCTIGPYCWAARRWVAPRPYKDVRIVAEGGLSPDRLTGSYLALYWLLAGYVQEWNRWAFREFRWLHDNGRMFPHRDHVHTLLYGHDWARYHDPDPIPASLALDHPFAGLVVVAGEATAGREAFDDWARGSWLPELHAHQPIEMTLSFTGVPLQVEAKDVARDDAPADRFLHLSFLRRDPLEVWDDTFAGVADEVAASGLGRVTWASPFVPTVPGTDRHTDELW